MRAVWVMAGLAAAIVAAGLLLLRGPHPGGGGGVAATEAVVEAAPPPPPAAPPQRLDRWRVVGPGGGGAQYLPSISPHDPRIVLVTCDMSGAYISENGGEWWRMFNLRGRVRHFAFDPKDAKVIYAATSSLWRSADTGKTWSLVYPAAASVRGVVYAGDDEPWGNLAGPAGGAGPMGGVAVDPEDSRTLYIASSNLLYVSRNTGQTWEPLGKAPGRVSKMFLDPFSPVENRRLYLIGTNWTGVWDAGQAVNHGAPQGTAFIYDASAGFTGGKAVLYVVTDFKLRGDTLTGGLLVSHDGGATWETAAQGIVDARTNKDVYPAITAVAASARRPSVVYASYKNLAAPGGRYFGVARSADAGRTWSLVWKEFTTPARNLFDAWISADFGPDWPENPLSLGASGTDPDVVYGSDYGRTMRSLDGGKTWYATYSYKQENGAYRTAGLDVTTSYGMHFDPADPKRILMSNGDIGPFVSEDGGATWSSTRKGGIPREWRNTMYWAVFDPGTRGRILAAVSGTHDLPRLKMFRRKSPDTFKGGIVASADGGRTWRASNAGLPDAAMTHILLDPRRGGRVVYTAAFGHGVYKSGDGGATWTAHNEGLPPSPFAWRLAEDGKGTLYLVVARRADGIGFGDDKDGMLFRRPDGAAQWERVTLPQGVNGPVGVAVDARNADRLYVAAWGRYRPGYGRAGESGGVWVSSDGGRSWRNTLAADQFIFDVTLSPHDPQTVFAAGFQSSAWRSTDGGENWKRIRGFNFKAAHRVIADPVNKDLIYVTTFGGGVWHGPAAGDPQAVEDIAAPAAVRYTN